MIQIKDIPQDLLGAVRKRLGADNSDDTSMDEVIQHMHPIEIMAKWSGWHLGDEHWARKIINEYEALKATHTPEKFQGFAENKPSVEGAFVSSLREYQK